MTQGRGLRRCPPNQPRVKVLDKQTPWLGLHLTSPTNVQGNESWRSLACGPARGYATRPRDLPFNPRAGSFGEKQEKTETQGPSDFLLDLQVPGTMFFKVDLGVRGKWVWCRCPGPHHNLVRGRTVPESQPTAAGVGRHIAQSKPPVLSGHSFLICQMGAEMTSISWNS